MIAGIFQSIGIPLLVLGIIIVIHELGHFLVAKFFHIKVETFSVGFGPRLIGYRYGDTDYRISAFPLGGYVKMSGENPGDAPTGAPNEFLSKPKWQRFLVAAAGPAMNIVLSLVLLTGLFMYGTEVPEFTEGDAIVGMVQPGSPAEAAGIQEGDRIISVPGKERPNWAELEVRILLSGEQTMPITLIRNGQTIETTLTPVKEGNRDAGFAGIRPKVRVLIGRIEPGYPAEKAGFKVGDEVVAVNGIDLKAAGRGMSEIMQEFSEKTFPINLLRDGQSMDISVSPVLEDGRRKIGVLFAPETVMIKEGFSQAFARSVDKNIESGTLVFRVLGQLVTRKTSMKAVDGPIGIMRATNDFYNMGFGPLITLMAMISMNLALMNLLPIPILDGGVMLLLVTEFLMGHDLSLAFKERVIQVSFVFLLTFMVFVLYNDVVKMLPTGAPGP